MKIFSLLDAICIVVIAFTLGYMMPDPKIESENITIAKTSNQYIFGEKL